MGLKIFEGPAHLASPAIPLEYLFAKQSILVRIEFQPGCPLTQSSHEVSQLLNYSRAVTSAQTLQPRCLKATFH